MASQRFGLRMVGLGLLLTLLALTGELALVLLLFRVARLSKVFFCFVLDVV